MILYRYGSLSPLFVTFLMLTFIVQQEFNSQTWKFILFMKMILSSYLIVTGYVSCRACCVKQQKKRRIIVYNDKKSTQSEKREY